MFVKYKNMLEKIISQENVDAVKQIVGDGNRFVVLAHKNPDGDAVGSTLETSFGICTILS